MKHVTVGQMRRVLIEAEVAPLDPPEQDRWLDRAEAEHTGRTRICGPAMTFLAGENIAKTKDATQLEKAIRAKLESAGGVRFLVGYPGREGPGAADRQTSSQIGDEVASG